jgi:hypothetical protein
MSKYALQYQSASKGPVDIETMATPHLINAWRKLTEHLAGLAVSTDAEVAAAELTGLREVAVKRCMEQELRSRGCTLGDEGRWNIPQEEPR